MNPPPGATITPVAFRRSEAGRKTVRLGLLTLATTSVFQDSEKYCFSG